MNSVAMTDRLIFSTDRARQPGTITPVGLLAKLMAPPGTEVSTAADSFSAPAVTETGYS